MELDMKNMRESLYLWTNRSLALNTNFKENYQ